MIHPKFLLLAKQFLKDYPSSNRGILYGWVRRQEDPVAAKMAMNFVLERSPVCLPLTTIRNLR